MRQMQRLAAAGAVVSLALSLGACADGQQPSDVEQPPIGLGETTTAAPPAAAGETPAATSGVTQISDIYGPGCSQVPTEGPGSAQGMVDDAVATAAGNNPLLTTLVKAVTEANLVDTLNSTGSSYTVFAPADPAFQELPPGTLQTLLADREKLTKILTYHVVPKRYDAKGLAEAGEVTTVEGETLAITGEADSLKIDEESQASVLCGNIPTLNATVFVIDKVLLPPGVTP